MSGDSSWAFVGTVCGFKVARDAHEFGCNAHVRFVFHDDTHTFNVDLLFFSFF